MKTLLTLTVLTFITACSHTPDEHRMERIEGVMHDHEIWEDPKTHLQWTKVPLPQKLFSQAQKVCAQKLDEKLEKFDLGMAQKWRMPSKADIVEAKKRGLRHAFNSRQVWISDATIYDRIQDKFKKIGASDTGIDVLCVSRIEPKLAGD